MDELQAQLVEARKIVNGLEFGTPEWESAMQVVRAIVADINSLTDFGAHTSREGNVWA